MNEHKNEKWLDEIISRSVDSGKLEFDAEKWKQKYPEETKMLSELAGQGSQTSSDREQNIWRTIMKSRITKFAAAAVIVVAVMIGIKPFGESTSVLAAMTKNVEQMPWIHTVHFKGEHRAETWMSGISKITAKKWDDDRLTFVDGIEQREYLYDPSQNKIFVSSTDYWGPDPDSPIQLMRTFIHRLEATAVSINTQDRLIDGIQMEIIKGQVPKGTDSVSVELFRDIENNLLARMEVLFPDPSKNILVAYDYPETGPMTVYDMGVSSDVEIVHLVAPPELDELREKINNIRTTDREPYVAISIPCDVTQLPTSFSGERNAIIGMWQNNKSWRCDAGYYGEEKVAKLRIETLGDNVQYGVKSLIPAVSDIVGGGKTYSLIREEWGDGKVKQRSATAYRGNLCIEEVCWPRMRGTVGVPVNWKVEYVTGPHGESLILIERTQDGRIPNDKGLHVKPTRQKWFFDPARDYICQRREKSILLYADWVTNKNWLKEENNPRFKWAGRDYEEIVEVLEYAQTSSGRWYPRMLRETYLWYDDANGEASVDQTSSYNTCRKIYLEENPEFPEGIFDPDKLPQ